MHQIWYTITSSCMVCGLFCVLLLVSAQKIFKSFFSWHTLRFTSIGCVAVLRTNKYRKTETTEGLIFVKVEELLFSIVESKNSYPGP
jgi:hypothetical protein